MKVSKIAALFMSVNNRDCLKAPQKVLKHGTPTRAGNRVLCFSKQHLHLQVKQLSCGKTLRQQLMYQECQVTEFIHSALHS